MACWAYEGMLLFGVLFIAGYLFGTLTQTRNAMDNRHGLQAFLFLIFGIYFVWLWSKGQTLAMKTWNIRLVDVQGRPVSQARALLRYLLSWIWLLPSLSLVWLFGLPTAGLVALVL
ncbi:MAG: RDD family protein, partial [Burkholderiales bacterium]|nr:RDD family protein [Burkholderiales bacterium]